MLYLGKNNFFESLSRPLDNKKIYFYDQYDQNIYMNIDDWIKFILPIEITQSKSSSQDLFRLANFCYKNGIARFILQHAKTLVNIKPLNIDYCILLVDIYLQCNMPNEALHLINLALVKYPRNGKLITYLAKVYYHLGKKDIALSCLFEGLMLDPNQADALSTYFDIAYSIDPTSCIENIKLFSKLQGSFMPDLLLAYLSLKKNDVNTAVDIYSRLSKKISFNNDVLISVVKTLSAFNKYSELISLIEPIYDFYTMPHIVGLKLLHAYAFCKMYSQGELLLHKFMNLNNPCYLNYLLNISNLLDTFKISPSNVKDSYKYTITIFDTPIWYYSLGNPKWLLNNTTKIGTIGLLPFIHLNGKDIINSNIYYEDNTSRLARSLPLYIGEKIHYETNFNFNYLLPIDIPNGPIIKRYTYNESYLHKIATKKNIPLLIFGTVDKGRNKYLFNINIYDSINRKFKVFPFSSNFKNFDKNINSMIIETLSCIKGIKFIKTDMYKSPSGNQLYNYLQLLSYSLTQTLISNKLININSILGERNIINSYFNYALNSNDNISKLLLLSGLSKSKTYNKEIYLEPKLKVMKFFSKNKSILNNDLSNFLNSLYNEQKK
ncbi:MAG: hypothetical protein J6Y29_06560 [Clostridiales bacterium]|nr:hypothetical protein [Clostridiales bacterium]